jgi:hypothetical protein
MCLCTSSLLNGLLQKKRGVRSGLPDVMVIACHHLVVFVELKSVSGIASKAQKQVRRELLSVGCRWWMARSARAALMALHRAGVPFLGGRACFGRGKVRSRAMRRRCRSIHRLRSIDGRITVVGERLRGFRRRRSSCGRGDGSMCDVGGNVRVRHKRGGDGAGRWRSTVSKRNGVRLIIAPRAPWRASPARWTRMPPVSFVR